MGCCGSAPIMTAVQDIRARLQPYTDVLDQQRTLHRSAAALLAAQCHCRAGSRFGWWLHHTESPMSTELQGVRQAADFAADLAAEVQDKDPSIQLNVRHALL